MCGNTLEQLGGAAGVERIVAQFNQRFANAQVHADQIDLGDEIVVNFRIERTDGANKKYTRKHADTVRALICEQANDPLADLPAMISAY